MAGGVYSTRFTLGQGPTKYDYFVPAGKRAIVKMITGANANGANTSGQVLLYIDGALIWFATIPGNTGTFGSGLMLVVNAGEKMTLWPTVAGLYASASGYLLDVSPVG